VICESVPCAERFGPAHQDHADHYRDQRGALAEQGQGTVAQPFVEDRDAEQLAADHRRDAAEPQLFSGQAQQQREVHDPLRRLAYAACCRATKPRPRKHAAASA
jgi:hypothetical protein